MPFRESVKAGKLTDENVFDFAVYAGEYDGASGSFDFHSDLPNILLYILPNLKEYVNAFLKDFFAFRADKIFPFDISINY